MPSKGRLLKDIFETIQCRRGRSIPATVLLALLLSSYGCAGVRSTPADSAAAKGVITSVNGEQLSKGRETFEGGYRVEIEGTCPESSPHVYLVVKPEGENYFQVQARVVRTTRTNWIGQALLGSPESGIGNRYAIFAICSTNLYKEGEKLEREPEGNKSAAIRYKRIRN